MLETTNRSTSNSSYDRDRLMRTQTPQSFRLGKLLWAHETAHQKGIVNSVASCTLMIELGETVFFAAGSEKNVKITTVDDIEIFKALLSGGNTNWFK